ncbi:thioredoxin [Neosynechococcus sphagnicola sy1]|uniref:Thioredoxin n=1 Tax=Neosynechococcus sphagnicola sy1 TaxID=1497020 RepID=A0A098TJA3_9CYAN|nr:thioredoxin domain-containing protein [Neosynechococcus sphagnicola]KGF72169.1 thioredoxin [Neosynechococcus sphagnicola sy1]
MSSVISLIDPAFDIQVLQATAPVLVYFWAPWCGPCRLMSPLMDWAATHYGDRLQIFKMEVDPNPESVGKYNIQGVPALMLFHAGIAVAFLEGVKGKQDIINFLDANLSGVN